jgi:peptide-methionine (S)-S-oxide reductase
MKIHSLFFTFITFSIFGCSRAQETIEEKKELKKDTVSNNNIMSEATFGAGCFWCIEACFKELKGVISVKSGYEGGHTENPTYEEVCSGKTGHAEVAKVVYDSTLISYDELLEVFWFVHDPTQLNRQGNDIGTQYRSVIFYHNDEQKKLAEAYKQKLTEEKVWDKPIVTEIVASSTFYPAEKYHDNYLDLNPENMYCQAIVRPKVDKFKKVFASKLKD